MRHGATPPSFTHALLSHALVSHAPMHAGRGSTCGKRRWMQMPSSAGRRCARSPRSGVTPRHSSRPKFPRSSPPCRRYSQCSFSSPRNAPPLVLAVPLLLSQSSCPSKVPSLRPSLPASLSPCLSPCLAPYLSPCLSPCLLTPSHRPFVQPSLPTCLPARGLLVRAQHASAQHASPSAWRRLHAWKRLLTLCSVLVRHGSD